MEDKRDDSREVIDSYRTSDEAWEMAHKFAKTLRARGLTQEMGVTVKQAGRDAFWVVLVKCV